MAAGLLALAVVVLLIVLDGKGNLRMDHPAWVAGGCCFPSASAGRDCACWWASREAIRCPADC